MRWFPKEEPKERLNSILSKLESDVGFYWLMYVHEIIKRYHNAKFVCLERDKKDVIKSYLKKPEVGINPVLTFLTLMRGSKDEVQYFREYVTEEELEQMDPGTREFIEYSWDHPMEKYLNLDRFLPDYNIRDPEKFLNQYCDEYHEQALIWEAKFPYNFMRIDMNYALNTTEGRNKILTHIGVVPNTAAH